MQITCWEGHTNSERGRSRTSSFDQGNFSHSQGLLREGGGVWEQRQCVNRALISQGGETVQGTEVAV